jgi:hypothetical protein
VAQRSRSSIHHKRERVQERERDREREFKREREIERERRRCTVLVILGFGSCKSVGRSLERVGSETKSARESQLLNGPFKTLISQYEVIPRDAHML